MPAIRTTRTDVVWNYVGTVISMASGFVLLPFLMRYLTGEELGLWYVYVAIANLTMLFEFGFNPTFARNIVYVVSGARRLAAEGVDEDSIRTGVDFHLLNVVVVAARRVYAAIAGATALLLATAGSAYVAHIASELDSATVWVPWTLFCVAIILNLFFLYATTVLRGYGDVAGENRVRTFAKLGQLGVTIVLLFAGCGLAGAAVGYLTNALLMRALALLRLRAHREFEAGRRADQRPVERSEVLGVLRTVGHLAWRDGVVQLAFYASSQAMSILCSLFLGLVETGSYSVLLQLATAVCYFAAAYPKSFYPAIQSCFAVGDVDGQRRLTSSGMVAYWALFALGVAGVSLAALPLLPLFKSGFHAEIPLFLVMCLYLGLLNQHSVFCNYIISMNEIPYMRGYLAAAILGVALVLFLCGALGMGAWGVLLGQAASQAVYNNWRWPAYACQKMGMTYRALWQTGLRYWGQKVWRR